MTENNETTQVETTDETKSKEHKGGWPKGKPRGNGRYTDGAVHVVPTVDPQLEKMLYEIKVEELFAYFIMNMRAQNKDRESIVMAFQSMKGALTPANIEFMIAEEKLKTMVAQNRTSLGYDKNDVNKMIEMAIKRVKAPPTETV